MNRLKENNILKNSLGQSHEYISRIIKDGDIAIDATSGNGGDTLFLARLVGAEGKVYSFDIQPQALMKTHEKLEAEGLENRVTQILDGHQNMDRHVTEKVKAIMFNLGYLPGGDHNIGTKGETTAQALEKAMELIDVNGLITCVVYYGGDSGFDEKDMIMDFIAHIDHKRFVVMKSEFVNQINCPPILICIEKLA